MSPASYLTAPPRVAGDIIARCYSRRMLWAVWIALGVSVLALLLGAGRAATQALRCFRALRGLRRELGDAAAALAASAERLAGHPDAAAKLEPALARLRRSTAQLSVLTAALDDVRDSWGRIAWVYPRK